MKERPLIYQDQDSLNSVRLIVSNAERAALTAGEAPILMEKEKVERDTQAILSGIAAGLAMLGFLAGLAAGAAQITGQAATSGAGVVTGLSVVGSLIGGIVINRMISGIALIVLAPVLVGFAVWYAVHRRLTAVRVKQFAKERKELRERAVKCRASLKKQLPQASDPRWQQELTNQLALVESVISNLDIDTARDNR